MLRLAIASVLAFTAGSVSAQVERPADFEYWPGASYRSDIPTTQEVLGHRIGERITWSADMRAYMNALAAAAPDRMRVIEYGRSWEGRPLIYAAISSPENIARLDEIKAGVATLSEPAQVTSDAADALIADLPGTLWLGYAVHGNEISSTDAAMMTAYHLLASREDPIVADILDKTIVFIDPLQNPDGRDRFIHHFEQTVGLTPDSDRLAAEHDEPWPGGRTNHYLFDLNRDWFAVTQPETRGRVAVLRDLMPLVFVDLHEMGGDNSYYFAPEAVPYNPHLATDQRSSLELFGRNNAAWFDRFGFDYFTREVYDAFYPGYGASWPSYYGAVAMTYEQASPRGLIFRKDTGREMHFREAVRHHFVTSISTAQVVAENREKLLRDFYEYRRSAIDEGASDDVRAFIIPTQADQATADKLAGLLAFHKVRVTRADADFSACRVDYAAGTYVIRTDQPAKRLIRTLMDQDVPMNPEFVAEQRRRVGKELPDQIYDVTAWSLPLMFNVAVDKCDRGVSVAGDEIEPDLIRPGRLTNPDAHVAFLVPWGNTAAARALTAALRQGLSVKTADLAFTQNGTRYPRGTLVFDRADNPDDLADRLAVIATQSGADVIGTDSGWVSDGPNFGSGNMPLIVPPRVAIAWDEPTSSYNAGNTRYVIERQFGYPVTAIRTDRLARADLRRYQVLILPEYSGFGGAGYAEVLGETGAQNLKDWVDRGGVLIGLGNALRWMTDDGVGLLATRREAQARDGDKQSGSESGGGKNERDLAPGTTIADSTSYRDMIRPDGEPPESAQGVIARAAIDPDHWLTAGLKPTQNILVSGPDIYRPLTLDKGVNAIRYAAPDRVLQSGILWENYAEQLAYKPFAVVQPHGRGQVIGFTQNPTVRAYLDGLNLAVINAIFRGSAHARPVR